MDCTHRVGVLHREAHSVRESERWIQAARIIAQNHGRDVIRIKGSLGNVCRNSVGESTNYNQVPVSFRHKVKLARLTWCTMIRHCSLSR